MRKVVLTVAALLPVLALAEEPAPAPAEAPKGKLTGEGEVAYLKSSGSSNQQTFKGFTNTRYQRDAWTHELRAEGLNETNNRLDLRTRERYLVVEKTSWNFTPRDYLFIKPQWERDHQGAYEYQTQVSAGYGHIFLKSDTLFLSTDLGAGYRHSKHDITRDNVDEGVGNAALKFEWKFRPGARFTEDVSVDTGEESTITRTRSALYFALNGSFNLVAAYETRNDDGPLTVEDSLTTVGLNYQIK